MLWQFISPADITIYLLLARHSQIRAAPTAARAFQKKLIKKRVLALIIRSQERLQPEKLQEFLDSRSQMKDFTNTKIKSNKTKKEI